MAEKRTSEQSLTDKILFWNSALGTAFGAVAVGTDRMNAGTYATTLPASLLLMHQTWG